MIHYRNKLKHSAPAARLMQAPEGSLVPPVALNRYEGEPVNGDTTSRVWFIMQNHKKMDDLGVPLCQETSMCMYQYIWT